jgi:hypothetical protein
VRERLAYRLWSSSAHPLITHCKNQWCFFSCKGDDNNHLWF